MKRLTDIVVSGTALILLSPILLLVALAIKAESRGPVLYGAWRAGRAYQKFRLWKFRTMYTGADANLKNLQHLNMYQGESEEMSPSHAALCSLCEQRENGCTMLVGVDGTLVCETVTLKKSKSTSVFFKLKDDPRITRVGKFLRNTSLDEIPQLINVLKGEMSLVGNRPLPLYEAEKLTGDDAAIRFMAPAGITGLWQVTKRGKADMSEEERIELDKQYAKKHDLKTDIKVIIKTIPAMLQSENV